MVLTSSTHTWSQDVPNHKSLVVLFKYFGGGEVEHVSHPTSTPEKQALEGEV